MAEADQQPISESAVREQLGKIVASSGFAAAVRSRRFLEFVVDQTLVGAEDQIKEYTIAIEVFGRKDSYDSREHSAVRVEAARVRNRLSQYYLTQGQKDELIIDLPKGRYVPRFEVRQAVEPAVPAPAPEPVRKRSGNPGWIAAAVVVGSVIAFWSLQRHRDAAVEFRYVPLTEMSGQETQPSISDDGSMVVYSKREAHAWHIFRRTGRLPAVNLSGDSPADDTQPTLSPKGTSIAFRSERDGGGIFVMESNGALKRISDFGYNPSWSPDGKTIACASEPVLRPDQRLGTLSSLWTIDVESHRTQRIFSGDAVQPAWSPNGKRIAYWAMGAGLARDIWTIAADGSSPRAVTSDRPLDWCPRWSPDGKYLYFLSDRDGAMNLWRVPIEESTGKALGPPEPQTTPSTDMSVFAIARTSGRMVYENRIITGRLIARELRTGESRTIVTMPPTRQPAGPDLSADGNWLTFYSVGKQEDIYVVHPDGSGLRQLTDDAFQDRGPRWSPDGTTIAFKSNRSGRSELWTIRPDGSELRQLTHTSGAEPIQPVWSPDGHRLAYNRSDGDSVILELGAGEGQTLPARGFQVRSWSPDGKKLLGQTASADKAAATMIEYDLGTGRTRVLGQGNQQTWSPDGKYVLFEKGGNVWRLDIATLKEDRIATIEPNRPIGFRLSRDQKYLYVSVSTIESDLWTREPAR
jgi:Tol biopolymer transport system component